jgi:DNA-binding MarR family transcriptional regulator
MPREAFAPFRLPYERRQPSRSFVAVLLALDELGRGYTGEIAERAGMGTSSRPGSAVHVLQRLYRQYLVDREREEGDPHELGRPLRTYYTPTPAGRELAAKLRKAGAA